jgi:hypothetical protein
MCCVPRVETNGFQGPSGYSALSTIPSATSPSGRVHSNRYSLRPARVTEIANPRSGPAFGVFVAPAASMRSCGVLTYRESRYVSSPVGVKTDSL